MRTCTHGCNVTTTPNDGDTIRAGVGRTMPWLPPDTAGNFVRIS